jgi:hypothetical protein
MTWIELAKEEAARLGVIITDEIADYILWEETAFPFDGPDQIRRQVAEFIEKHGKNFEPKTEGPTVWNKLDESDDS